MYVRSCNVVHLVEGCHSLPVSKDSSVGRSVPPNTLRTHNVAHCRVVVFTDEGGGELEFRKLKSVNTYEGVGRPSRHISINLT